MTVEISVSFLWNWNKKKNWQRKDDSAIKACYKVKCIEVTENSLRPPRSSNRNFPQIGWPTNWMWGREYFYVIQCGTCYYCWELVWKSDISNFKKKKQQNYKCSAFYLNAIFQTFSLNNHSMHNWNAKIVLKVFVRLRIPLFYFSTS